MGMFFFLNKTAMTGAGNYNYGKCLFCFLKMSNG